MFFEVNIDMTFEKQKLLKMTPENKQKANMFFRHRAGRTRAFMSKQACQTNAAKQSHSLTAGICILTCLRLAMQLQNMVVSMKK